MTKVARFSASWIELLVLVVGMLGGSNMNQFFSHDAISGRMLMFNPQAEDRKSTRLNSSHSQISYAVFCLNDTATTQIYTLSLHDALPISVSLAARGGV